MPFCKLIHFWAIHRTRTNSIKNEIIFRPKQTKTTTVASNDIESSPSLEYIPNLPDLVAEGATEDTSRIYDHSAEYLGKCLIGWKDQIHSG